MRVKTVQVIFVTLITSFPLLPAVGKATIIAVFALLDSVLSFLFLARFVLLAFAFLARFVLLLFPLSILLLSLLSPGISLLLPLLLLLLSLRAITAFLLPLGVIVFHSLASLGVFELTRTTVEALRLAGILGHATAIRIHVPECAARECETVRAEGQTRRRRITRCGSPRSHRLGPSGNRRDGRGPWRSGIVTGVVRPPIFHNITAKMCDSRDWGRRSEATEQRNSEDERAVERC